MTTVVADSKLQMMAADSLVGCGGGQSFLSPKLFHVGRSIYGLAGDNYSNVFVEWAQTNFNEKKKPVVQFADIDFAILELAPTGLYVWDKHWVRIPLKDTIYAIGSGSDIATIAIKEMGYTLEMAVELAIKYDMNSGPPIDVMNLTELNKKFK